MECIGESEADQPQITADSKNEFLEYGKEDLLNLLTSLETELEAREIAFNVLKLKFSRREISVYYGCLEALQCDGFLQKCNEGAGRAKSKDMQSFHETRNDSLRKVFSAKNKALLVLKFQLQILQENYQKVCQLLSDDKKQLMHFKGEFSKFRELFQKENDIMREELDRISTERNSLLSNVQSLEEELELMRKRYQVHKDGSVLLVKERNWMAKKISYLINVVTNLEDSLEFKDNEVSNIKTELEKIKSDYEVARISLSRSQEDLSCEFSKIIKSKDEEISKLKRELETLKNKSPTLAPAPNHKDATLPGARDSPVNGTKKGAPRNDCKSVYDNVDHSLDDGDDHNNNESDDKVWIPRELDSARVSPFSEMATIKRGSFIKPGIPEDFSGFDIFGREMADLQELLVSMASPNDLTGVVHKQPAAEETKNSRVDDNRSVAKPVDVKTFLLSIQTAISNGDSSKLREALVRRQRRPDPSSFHHKLPIGILPLHYAVECCSEACVRVLLENGFDANAQNEDKMSAIHIASSEGSLECLKALLDSGASVLLTNHIGMTPLHCAASSGHVDCCTLLLHRGAQIDALNLNNWTPIHMCTFSGHSQCLKALLEFKTSDKSRDAAYEASIIDIINMADKDGCTLAHVASANEAKDCLEVLAQVCILDLQRRDKWNRSLLDVASQACLSFLLRSETTQEITCGIVVDIGWGSGSLDLSKSEPTKNLGSATTYSSPSRAASSGLGGERRSCSIGCTTVSKATHWAEVEEKLSTSFLNHISEVSIGLRTKKISRSEQESPDTPNPFTMGLTVKSIKYFSIGRYHWSPGTLTEKSPFEMLTTNNTSTISIKLFGLDSNNPDSLAYDSLIPIYVLQNYVRLVQQYKSVVFYGPKGVGKSYLVRRLAAYIQSQESISGITSDISCTNLHSSFTNTDLIKLFIDKGCLIDSKQLFPPPTAPILILDDLTQVSVEEVFKEISASIENRGPSHKFIFKSDVTKDSSYYMHPSCFIICTMDKPRSIGLELSIQQRFKWVQLRCDQEPSKYLLHRHLLRNLADSHQGSVPLPDNSTYKAVEWLICVWQRLNDGIVKLGLLDLVFGPCYFLPCPIEKNKPKAILRWLISLWNQVIAPAISEAVVKSSGSVLPKEGDGQQKVTSTALYVLMQRAIVPGCPLAGQERDRYLACFHGSNDLDIKVKADRRDAVRPSHFGSPSNNSNKPQFRSPEISPGSRHDWSPSSSPLARLQGSNETLTKSSASGRTLNPRLPSRSMNELFLNSPSATKQLFG